MDDENFKIPPLRTKFIQFEVFLAEGALPSFLHFNQGKTWKSWWRLCKMKKERKSTRRWENWGKKFLFEVSTLWSVVESGFFSYLISLKCSQNLQSLSLFLFFSSFCNIQKRRWGMKKCGGDESASQNDMKPRRAEETFIFLHSRAALRVCKNYHVGENSLSLHMIPSFAYQRRWVITIEQGCGAKKEK